MKLTPEYLASLSKEEKLRLLDLMAEKKRRAKEQRTAYSPNSGQRPVHVSPAKLRAVFSGNGAGKTAMATNEALWAAHGYNPVTETHTPVPCRVIVVLDKPDKVDSVWLPELKKWVNLKPEQLHKRGKPYINHITFDNGSYITFMFHDQEPMSFESVEADVFIFDEPPPRHVYIALRRGGRTKGRPARFLIIGTPIAAAWMRKEIYEPWAKGEAPDTECFKFGTTVNQANLADGYIESFASVLSEKERRIRLEGEFFDLEGLALAHLFDRTIHVLRRDEYAFDKSNPCVVVIDPHPNKKHVAILLGADEYGPVYLKEIAYKLTARQFAPRLKEMFQGYRVVDIVCDSLGNADMTGGEGFKSFIQVLRDEGIQVRATTYEDKSDEDWITRIQDALLIPSSEDSFGQKVPKLRILEGNSGVIADIETVQWAKVRNMDEYKPTLDISHKDYLACVKYGLATNMSKDKGKDKVYYQNKPAYGMPLAGSRQRKRLYQPKKRTDRREGLDEEDQAMVRAWLARIKE
jgi:hypothetical protein